MREMTREELEKLGLVQGPSYDDDDEETTNEYPEYVHKPIFESVAGVWATAIDENTPTYRVYNCGTNDLRIFEYTPVSDTWKKVDLNGIGNLYGLIWRMTLEIGR